MVIADDMAQVQEGLTLLFQRGLELSLQVQADAMAAGSAEERADLAVAFHRVSRSVRQTAALKMRLARDAQLAEREALRAGQAQAQARVAQRRARVTAAVKCLIWTEAESEDEAYDREADLERFLDEDALAEDFVDQPLKAQVERLAREIGLSWAADPTPPTAAAAEPP